MPDRIERTDLLEPKSGLVVVHAKLDEIVLGSFCCIVSLPAYPVITVSYLLKRKFGPLRLGVRRREPCKLFFYSLCDARLLVRTIPCLIFLRSPRRLIRIERRSKCTAQNCRNQKRVHLLQLRQNLPESVCGRISVRGRKLK